ncbi:MAG: hypothetical protein ABJN65_07745 [Parasphingorhabdus sp.]
MKKIASLSTAALVAAAFVSFPASAQDQPGDKVNQLIIYGDDVCPESKEGEIVVCARKDEGDRYRIPENLRAGELGQAKNEAWAQRVKSYEYVGASGTSSCSPTGAGGFTGCTQSLLRQAYAERGIDDTVNWGKLIEEERQKRLSRIDGESDAVEERLLEIEAQREARLRAAADAQGRLAEQDEEANRATSDLVTPPAANETPTTSPQEN